jgi:hypothetical protein
MRATGLSGDVQLIRPDWSPGNAAVETWAGDQGWTGGIFPSDAADDLSALVAVAEQARQAIMESLRYQSTGRKWPTCPVHGLGTSPRAHTALASGGATAVTTWLRRSAAGRPGGIPVMVDPAPGRSRVFIKEASAQTLITYWLVITLVAPSVAM